MRVLGLVASPRKLGNSEILVKEMLAFLPDNVNKEMMRLTDLKIGNCNACYACLPEDKDCVIEDDFNFFLSKVKEADAIILGTPCYFLGAHTSLKVLGDRLISVLREGAAFAGKKCVIAISYGVPGWNGYAREAAINFARFLHLDVVGTMVVQAANPGEVVKPNVLTEAQQLAASLMQPHKELNSSESMYCPACSSSLLQMSLDGKVRCPMCAATGRLSVESNKLDITWEEAVHSRFSPQGMAEHAELLEQIKSGYLANRSQLYGMRKPYQQYDNWWVKR